MEESGRTRRPASNHLARRPRWAADRFAHSAGPGRNISLHPGPFLRPSAPRGRQLGTKKSKNGANNPPRWGPEAPKSSQDGAKTGSKPRKSRIKRQRNKEEGSTPQHRPTLGENGANMAQFGSQNGAKMAKKIDPELDHFLMSLGIDVWAEFGGFLVPKWSQVGTKMGSKIDVYLEGRFF